MITIQRHWLHVLSSAVLASAFALGSAHAQTAPTLGTAANFGVLGGSTVTNTGPTTISADVGLSPGLSITGFPPGVLVGGTLHAGDAVAAQAQSDLVAAYNALASQSPSVDLSGQDLGGLTLTPGIYDFSTSAFLTGTLTLDAQGNPNAVFILRTGSTLTTASASNIVLINGAADCNVFWQIGSSATLGTGSRLVGNVLALTSITLNTSAAVSGRVLARNGAVTMDSNTISACGAGCPLVSLSPPSLPAPVVGQLYDQTISASGPGPHTFSISSGTLPPGLTLTSAGPSSARISGIPTAAGDFTFVLTAVGAGGCAASAAFAAGVGFGGAAVVVPASSPGLLAVLGLLMLAAGLMFARRRVPVRPR